MSIKFNYYYGKEAEQFSFFRIPKLLFTDSTFSKLSSDAKVLYGILLDRMNLSMKNGWLDEENKVYIIFTISARRRSSASCWGPPASPGGRRPPPRGLAGL